MGIIFEFKVNDGLAYQVGDLEPGKAFHCLECGKLSKPFMVLKSGNLFYSFCSFVCAVRGYIELDMKPAIQLRKAKEANQRIRLVN